MFAYVALTALLFGFFFQSSKLDTNHRNLCKSLYDKHSEVEQCETKSFDEILKEVKNNSNCEAEK